MVENVQSVQTAKGEEVNVVYKRQMLHESSLSAPGRL